MNKEHLNLISEVNDFIEGFKKWMWNLKQKFKVARLEDIKESSKK